MTTPAAASSGAEDWRQNVQQADRNKKVREIAQVLASLEPGATSASKLRLAMQFEDSVFKSADSLSDYHKRLNKRLKKLQKNYVPTQPAGANEKERTIERLRQNHGESIRYVLEFASKAVQEMRNKHGDEKAKQLKQHLDGAVMWAQDLGLMANTKPKYTMSNDHLEKLKGQIERRLENLRAHVVKLADPDRFFVETLEKTEEDCKGRASKLLAIGTKKRYTQLFKTDLDAVKTWNTALEDAFVNVPLSTRSQQNDTKGALIRIEKMRAASTLVLAFMCAGDKTALAKGNLKKAHAVVTEGSQFVQEVIRARRREAPEADISLQDAWLKHIDLESKNDTTNTATSTGAPPPSKRARIGVQKPILRSRILLTGGRKTPTNLLPSFRMKRAELVRPPPNGEGSHLILKFGKAFVMIIYFVPLLVELRALPTKASSKQSTSDADSSACAKWIPLHQGLVSPESSTSDSKASKSYSDSKQPVLSVWGVKGDYESIGHVVEERLRDASAHATYVLRQCFSKSLAGKEGANDFEIEILEGTALLDFLQMARTTYIPNWKDADPSKK